MDSFYTFTLFFLVSLLGGSLAKSLPSRILDVIPYTVVVLTVSTAVFVGLKSLDALALREVARAK